MKRTQEMQAEIRLTKPDFKPTYRVNASSVYPHVCGVCHFLRPFH
ncbi:MAG: hypothetical protein SPF78_07870 [Lachnospiraceae bacterium]|nr:hypothetical protein [Lachnospiraceae bacterium]